VGKTRRRRRDAPTPLYRPVCASATAVVKGGRRRVSKAVGWRGEGGITRCAAAAAAAAAAVAIVALRLCGRRIGGGCGGVSSLRHK